MYVIIMEIYMFKVHVHCILFYHSLLWHVLYHSLLWHVLCILVNIKLLLVNIT